MVGSLGRRTRPDPIFCRRIISNYAVDYDGDGRRDLLHSAADVIGSTANYIASGLKWRRGEPWLQESARGTNPRTVFFPGIRPISRSSCRRSKWGAAWRDLSGWPRAAERQTCRRPLFFHPEIAR